jgi:hypothetical protein
LLEDKEKIISKSREAKKKDVAITASPEERKKGASPKTKEKLRKSTENLKRNLLKLYTEKHLSRDKARKSNHYMVEDFDKGRNSRNDIRSSNKKMSSPRKTKDTKSKELHKIENFDQEDDKIHAKDLSSYQMKMKYLEKIQKAHKRPSNQH